MHIIKEEISVSTIIYEPYQYLVIMALPVFASKSIDEVNAFIDKIQGFRVSKGGGETCRYIRIKISSNLNNKTYSTMKNAASFLVSLYYAIIIMIICLVLGSWSDKLENVDVINSLFIMLNNRPIDFFILWCVLYIAQLIGEIKSMLISHYYNNFQ